MAEIESADFSFEDSPDLWLFTSLTAGSSHIITATSRLETILKANRVPFKAVDCATFDKARKIWARRASGKKLPGLVKDGFVIADLETVEEWNEYGELKQQLGITASAPPPGLKTKAATSGTTGETKAESTPTPQQSHQSQLANEAAAVAAQRKKATSQHSFDDSYAHAHPGLKTHFVPDAKDKEKEKEKGGQKPTPATDNNEPPNPTSESPTAENNDNTTNMDMDTDNISPPPSTATATIALPAIFRHDIEKEGAPPKEGGTLSPDLPPVPPPTAANPHIERSTWLSKPVDMEKVAAETMGVAAANPDSPTAAAELEPLPEARTAIVPPSETKEPRHEKLASSDADEAKEEAEAEAEKEEAARKGVEGLKIGTDGADEEVTKPATIVEGAKGDAKDPDEASKSVGD